MNVKFCAIGRLTDTALLVTYSHESHNSSAHSSEVGEIIKKLADYPIGEGQRQKVGTQTGVWNFIADGSGIVYFLMTKTDYPERHAFAMIEEVKENVREYGNLQTIDAGVLRSSKSTIFQPLCRKYNDVATLDPLAMAQSRVNTIHDVASDTLRDMMKRGEDIGKLQGKTDDMKTLSKSFGDKSNQLKKLMWWRKCKINAILFLIVAAVLAYILVPILGDELQGPLLEKTYATPVLGRDGTRI